jgi:hypothetical protein
MLQVTQCFSCTFSSLMVTVRLIGGWRKGFFVAPSILRGMMPGSEKALGGQKS